MPLIRFLASLLTGLLFMPATQSVFAQEQIYVVINHPSTAIEPVRLRLIIRGEQRNWQDGLPITVVLPGKRAESYNSVGQTFFSGSGTQMQRYWLQLVFSGRGRTPLFAESDNEVYTLVASIPGAIGVVAAQPPPGLSVHAEVLKE